VVQLHAFLTLALDGGEWSASFPCLFIRRDKNPWYPRDRRIGGPQSRSVCSDGGGGGNPIIVPAGN
jgi:hypothetical protein